jgi:hypothetical protein
LGAKPSNVHIANRNHGRLTLEQLKVLSDLWDATRPLGEDEYEGGVDLSQPLG